MEKFSLKIDSLDEDVFLAQQLSQEDAFERISKAFRKVPLHERESFLGFCETNPLFLGQFSLQDFESGLENPAVALVVETSQVCPHNRRERLAKYVMESCKGDPIKDKLVCLKKIFERWNKREMDLRFRGWIV